MGEILAMMRENIFHSFLPRKVDGRGKENARTIRDIVRQKSQSSVPFFRLHFKKLIRRWITQYTETHVIALVSEKLKEI